MKLSNRNRKYMWKSDRIREKKFDPETCERCVVCKKRTDISVDLPISERKCYVPGGGQLCRKCCIQLYGTDDLRSLQSAEIDQMFL